MIDLAKILPALNTKKPDKEFEIFYWSGVAAFTLSLFFMPFIAIAALPLGGRALLLTFNKNFEAVHQIARLRAMLIVLLVAAVWWLIVA